MPRAQFAELEAVGASFRDMTDEIQSLKLSLYEKQMEQQEIISFMRLRIKPHFCLHCLNHAHAMAGRAQYEKAMPGGPGPNGRRERLISRCPTSVPAEWGWI